MLLLLSLYAAGLLRWSCLCGAVEGGRRGGWSEVEMADNSLQKSECQKKTGNKKWVIKRVKG
jgi:hypothetical protein